MTSDQLLEALLRWQGLLIALIFLVFSVRFCALLCDRAMWCCCAMRGLDPCNTAAMWNEEQEEVSSQKAPITED